MVIEVFAEKRERGLIYTLEAILASLMIFSLLFLITTNIPRESRWDPIILKHYGIDALFTLDKIPATEVVEIGNNTYARKFIGYPLLRYALINRRFKLIKDELENMLPPDIGYRFMVRYGDEEYREIFGRGEPREDKVVVHYYITHYLYGEAFIFRPTDIKLELWYER